MLETPGERVELLKAGVDGKTIERLYVELNGFKIYNIPDNILCVKEKKDGVSVPFIEVN